MKDGDPRVKWFHGRRFCLRPGNAPELPRASGDSGFVAHLTHATHGATGWDWGFKLLRRGDGWFFTTDGRLALFLDERGQMVPEDAKVGEPVAVRLPRARENLVPHRFTLHGGQGGPVIGKGFAKYFVPVTFEYATKLVELCASRSGDPLRFSLAISNSPADFARADSAVIDVGPSDEDGVVRILEAFVRAHPKGLAPRGIPFGTSPGPLDLPRAEGAGRGDLADGYGWRRSREAVAEGLDQEAGGRQHVKGGPR